MDIGAQISCQDWQMESPVRFSFTQESKEALSDLSAMGQVSDESNEDDDDERLYYELVEHARLSVQIIFSEINTSINEPLS